MNVYYVKKNSGADTAIEGENLVQAIEDNFASIAADAGVGNVAGYNLEQVWMEYDCGIFGGKGGAVLHILATGSDVLANYDPIGDKPKEITVWIGGVKKEELPKPHIFELNENKEKPTPFDHVDNPAIALGYALAIIDEIARHHTKLPEDDSLVNRVQMHYPNLMEVDPVRALNYMLRELHRLRPLQRVKTERLMARLDELATIVMDADPKTLQQDGGRATLAQYHATYYFRTANKITALAHYRKKAGLSLAALAEKTDISVRQLCKYEAARGTTLGDAKYSAVERIAKAIGVTPQDLVQNGITVLMSADQE